MLYVLISLLALAAGPFLAAWARRVPAAALFVDAFVLTVIGGFVLLHVLPDSLAAGGWPAAALLAVGVFAPLLVDKGLHHGRGGTTRAVIVVLALIGLGLHAIVDGMALAQGSAPHVHEPGTDHAHDHGEGNAMLLVWAVLLHRIPIGVSIWWIVPRTLGVTMAIVTLLVEGLGTVVGYALGPTALTGGSEQGIRMFEALLSGSLLHVILHAHVPPPRATGRPKLQIASTAGLFTAIAIVWAVLSGPAHSGHSHGGEHGSPGATFLALALESAPALLLAYLAIGAAHAFLPPDFFARATRGGRLRQALRGVAIGIPLPLCSCGIVPIYRDLIVRGASVTAAVAFLIATPELEIAAVLLTFQLLGTEVAIARIVVAALLAIGVALLLGVLLPRPQHGTAAEALAQRPRAPLGARVATMFRFGLGDAVDHTAAWLLAGLGLSAMLTPYLDAEAIAGLPHLLEVPLAALLGLPIYVCASGSTPLAAVLVAQGLSPGAALAFLLTGPATNVTTFGVLSMLHGKRAALWFAIAMFAGATLLGFLVDALLPAAVTGLDASAWHDHGEASLLQIGSLGVLSLLVLGSVLRQGTRGFTERLFVSPGGGTGPDAHDHGGDAGGGDCCHADEPSHAQARSHEHDAR